VRQVQEQHKCDPKAALDLLIDEMGQISSEYGGYIIEIYDMISFPWSAVLRTLLRIGHEVWIEERNGKIVIVSKPKTD